MIQIDLRDAHITKVDTGTLFLLNRKPLDSIYVTFEVNGFEKSVTFKDNSFRHIMDVIQQEILNLEHEDLYEMSDRKG